MKQLLNKLFKNPVCIFYDVTNVSEIQYTVQAVKGLYHFILMLLLPTGP